MNNTTNAISSIFTGKGGTLKLTIVVTVFAAVIYEIMDSNYGLNVTTKEGAVTLAPNSGTNVQEMQIDSDQKDDQVEQDQSATAVEDIVEG